jgi:hypothetical protein
MVALRQRPLLKKGDWVTLVAFSGGYSVGAALARAEQAHR